MKTKGFRPGRPGMRYVGVDLDITDFETLEKVAKAEQRTMSSMIRVVIRDWLSMYVEKKLKDAGLPPAPGLTTTLEGNKGQTYVP